MTKYLGEEIIEYKESPYKNYKQKDWVLYFITNYGQIEGDNHKAWVLDQVVRIVNGTKVIIKLAKWDNGNQEYRIILDTPTKEYLQYVENYKNSAECSYYDCGIAP